MGRRLVLCGLLGLALIGCGGDEPAQPAPGPEYPPTAAEPAAAPEPSEEPAGTVVPLGARRPEGLVFDPQTGLVAVAMDEPAQLALVNGRDGSVMERVPLPAGPRHLDLAGPGGPVLVPAEESGELVVVELPGGESRSTAVGEQPHDAASRGDRYYVVNEFSSTVTAVEDGRVVGESVVDAQPGGVAVAGDVVAVISVLAFTIELFDADTLEGGGSRNAGIGPTHAVSDREGRIYITDTRGDAIIVYETRPRLRWVGRLELPGSPYGIAIDEENGRVWVTLTERNEVVELETGDQPRELRRFPTVRQPNSVAVDPESGRVFVASQTDGTLQLVDP